MGITKGSEIYVRKVAPLGDPLELTVRGYQLSIRKSEAEKIEIVKKLGDKKYTLQRSKGLGENEPEMMSRTTMCPQTRRLIAVTPADAEETARMFEVLLGDALAERKKFITERGHLYINDADI